MCFQDVAILTNDVTKCNDYRDESQNQKDKYECLVYDPATDQSEEIYYKYANWHKNFKVPNNQAECEVCYTMLYFFNSDLLVLFQNITHIKFSYPLQLAHICSLIT